MAEFSIPCATFVRLAKVLKIQHPEATPWFNSVRIDNGIALASNRRLIVGEMVGGSSGVVHIPVDPALLAICEKEAPYDSVLTVTVIEALNFGAAKTSMGAQYQGNAMVNSQLPNDMDRWRTVLPAKPATASKGCMFWQCDQIALLAETSVSGTVVFEEFIDIRQATIVRDMHDDRWFGLVRPFSNDPAYKPAKRPEWL